MIIYQNH